MMGWMVLVYPKSNEDGKLASWEVGVSGLRWLDALVAEGKAEKLNGNGYPLSLIHISEPTRPY